MTLSQDVNTSKGQGQGRLFLGIKNTFIEEAFFEEGISHDDSPKDPCRVMKRSSSDPALSTPAGMSSWSQIDFFSTDSLPEAGDIFRQTSKASVQSEPSTQESLRGKNDSWDSELEYDLEDLEKSPTAAYPDQGDARMNFRPHEAPAPPLPTEVLVWTQPDVHRFQLGRPVGALASHSAFTFEWANISTVMLRNLPNKVTQSILLLALHDSGFKNTYDFVHLPMDMVTKVNRGYGFINFIYPELAFQFVMRFEGAQFENYTSRKVLSVVPAVVQGFDANYALYSKSFYKEFDALARPVFLRRPENAGMNNKVAKRRTPSMIDTAAAEQRIRNREQCQECQQEFCGSTVAADRAAATGMEAATMQGGAPKPCLYSFCPGCGGSCEPNHKFCKFCGVSLSLSV